MTDTGKLADIAERLARRALAFGQIEREICRHPDGRPETGTTHTVMLAWLAPALADLLYPRLDPVLVAAFAVVHDAVEVYTGGQRADLLGGRVGQAVGLGAREAARPDVLWAARRARELAAAATWAEEFGSGLPWLPAMIIRYEAQEEPEARFTRAVDKLLPAMVHFGNGGRYLAGYGVTADEIRDRRAASHAEMAAYAADFPAFLELRGEISARLEALLRKRGTTA